MEIVLDGGGQGMIDKPIILKIRLSYSQAEILIRQLQNQIDYLSEKRYEEGIEKELQRE